MEPFASLPALALSLLALAPPPGYHFEARERLRELDSSRVALLEKLNRRDVAHLARMDSVLVPDSGSWEERDHSPLPRTWYWSASTPKLLVVDQALQAFAAYDSGRLVRWGPVSTGAKASPTPTGVFHLNWKAKSWRSTVDTSWILRNYFNFANDSGVSFHAYALPGHPASHACVRLLDRDAEWLYGWGDAWRLSRDGRRILLPGTPVIILGVPDYRRDPLFPPRKGPKP